MHVRRLAPRKREETRGSEQARLSTRTRGPVTGSSRASGARWSASAPAKATRTGPGGRRRPRGAALLFRRPLLSESASSVATRRPPGSERIVFYLLVENHDVGPELVYDDWAARVISPCLVVRPYDDIEWKRVRCGRARSRLQLSGRSSCSSSS